MTGPLRHLVAITESQPITYGDLIVVLVILVLTGACLYFWRRR